MREGFVRMGEQGDHNRLIREAARAVLKPIGVRQKGRSRMWLDDQGWWLGVVEFQPSSYSRGTYLNVGVHWLWMVEPHVSFDLSERVHLPSGEHHGQWFAYESESQFQPLIAEVVTTAKGRIEGYRATFKEPSQVARSLDVPGAPILQRVDAGVAYGLAGQVALARACMEPYLDWLASESGRPVPARDEKVAERFEALDDPDRFKALILNDITAKRRSLGLPARGLPL